MMNQIRSAIGGLALLASTALGQSVTNAPAITRINVIGTPTAKEVTIAATNFHSSAYAYELQCSLKPSTNNADWAKVGRSYLPTSSPTNEVPKTVVIYNNDSHFNDSFFRIYGRPKL